MTDAHGEVRCLPAPLWTDAGRDRCTERCAQAGDMPCYEIAPRSGPCAECREPDEYAPEPLDPAAVVRELL